MTASITIVNTSNWDGENFRLGGNRVLRPGDSVVIHPEHGSDNATELSLTPEFKDTKPIQAPGSDLDPSSGESTRHNRQVFPKVRVTFES